MSRAHSCFPSLDEGLSLHHRLCEHDPVAPADICAAYLEPLVHWLGLRYPRVHPDVRQTAVHDALIGYLKNPAGYAPSKGSLEVFLRLAAKRDLLNLFQR